MDASRVRTTYTGAAVLPQRRFEVIHDAQQPFDGHLESGFFQDFAHHGIFDLLHPIDLAAGQAPVALFRLTPALDQQDRAIGALDDGTATEAGLLQRRGLGHQASP